MEQIKRLRSEIISDDYNENKRQKRNMLTRVEANCSTKDFVTTLEDLSNELIYEIFEFLDLYDAFQGFYDLNERFQHLFVHSNLPIKINISLISKSTFSRYLTDIIIPHTNRIQSFRLSNPFAGDMSLLLNPIMKNLTRLKTLIINNIESNYIEQIINQLSSLPILSSLTITTIDNIKNQNDIYQKIFRLSRLKYCQLSIETLRRLKPLSIAMNEFSPIEHLIINNKVSLDQLDSLFSYVPQLRRLSFGHLDGYRASRQHSNSIALHYLLDVSLKLDFISFDEFEQLIMKFFRQIQILRIGGNSIDSFFYDVKFLNADLWEHLISTHLTNLSTIDFQYQNRTWGYLNYATTYETQINKFNSLFWMKRQWFFEYQYYQKRFSNIIIFYSTNPYRRRHYMICEESNKNNWSRHSKYTEDRIHHLYIHSTKAMSQSIGYFSNVTELTLSKSFDILDDSIITSLNRIISLRQLTKLTLDYHRLPVEQVVELLYHTPNIHTLKLEFLSLYSAKSIRNGLFQIVSTTNIVTNITIGKESTLENIQLLVSLFPRLKYLTINLYKENLESIARFLLSKSNDNTRHLSSLCISKQRNDMMEVLKSLLESENLLHDYILKVINRKLYLWW